MREGEARGGAGGERGEVQGKVQSAVERETREGGVGPRPGGPACQSGEDGAHHGALRDRSETVREVSVSSSRRGRCNISRRRFFFFFFSFFFSSPMNRPCSGHHLVGGTRVLLRGQRGCRNQRSLVVANIPLTFHRRFKILLIFKISFNKLA